MGKNQEMQARWLSGWLQERGIQLPGKERKVVQGQRHCLWQATGRRRVTPVNAPLLQSVPVLLGIELLT
jgi:hypothetical protein